VALYDACDGLDDIAATLRTFGDIEAFSALISASATVEGLKEVEATLERINTVDRRLSLPAPDQPYTQAAADLAPLVRLLLEPLRAAHNDGDLGRWWAFSDYVEEVVGQVNASVEGGPLAECGHGGVAMPASRAEAIALQKCMTDARKAGRTLPRAMEDCRSLVRPPANLRLACASFVWDREYNGRGRDSASAAQAELLECAGYDG
jgi:hypothetical protein